MPPADENSSRVRRETIINLLGPLMSRTLSADDMEVSTNQIIELINIPNTLHYQHDYSDLLTYNLQMNTIITKLSHPAISCRIWEAFYMAGGSMNPQKYSVQGLNGVGKFFNNINNMFNNPDFRGNSCLINTLKEDLEQKIKLVSDYEIEMIETLKNSVNTHREALNVASALESFHLLSLLQRCDFDLTQTVFVMNEVGVSVTAEQILNRLSLKITATIEHDKEIEEKRLDNSVFRQIRTNITRQR